MASFELRSPDYNGLVYLRNFHRFGRRNDSADTSLNYSPASKLHAVIEWREQNWLLKDLSKNGLTLNNKMLTPKRQVALDIGDTIDFAGMGEVVLTINNIDPPVPMLINQTLPTDVIEITQSMLLPNEETPEVALYLCPDRQQLLVERIDDGIESGPYENRDIIEFDGVPWEFLLLVKNGATKLVPKPISLDDVTFRFDVSQEKGSVNLTLIEDGLEIDIGEQPHNSLLVYLLRNRSEHDDDPTWVENELLRKELGLNQMQINLHVFHARTQIAAALPNVFGHSTLIERRRGALRTNINNFEIYKDT